MGVTITMANKRGMILGARNAELEMDLSYGNFYALWDAMRINPKSPQDDTTGSISVDALDAIVRANKGQPHMDPFEDYLVRLGKLIEAAKRENAPSIAWA